MRTPSQLADKDAIFGYELMELLNMSKDEFQIHQRFDQFNDIYDYFKPLGIKEARYWITKICVGKPVDRLEHTWAWTQLRNELKVSQNSERVKEELSFYEK